MPSRSDISASEMTVCALHCKVDVSVGNTTIANAVQPVAGMDHLIFLTQLPEVDAIDFLRFMTFGRETDLIAGIGRDSSFHRDRRS